MRGLVRPRTQRWGKWFVIGGTIVGGLAVLRVAAAIPGAYGVLALIVASGATRTLLTYDPAVEAGPHPHQLTLAQIAAVAGGVVAVFIAPTAWGPYQNGRGATGHSALITTVLLLGACALPAWVGRAAVKHGSRSLVAVLAEARRISASRHRAIAWGLAAAGAILAATFAGCGVPYPAVYGLALVLAPSRAYWSTARTALTVRADVAASLNGLLLGGAWTVPLRAAGRAPIRDVTVDGDGAPTRIVLPLPPAYAAKSADDTEAEIAHRLSPWGKYVVRLGVGADRAATADRIPPLPEKLRYDGRAAVGGSEVWLGTGLATREHSTAPGTRGVRNGEGFDFRWDLRTEPHGIAVGLTGQGKSVSVSLIVQQLLLTGAWRAMMIDPKRVEFSQWVGRPGVLRVTTELADHVEALADAREEMEARYRAMTAAGVNNIDQLPLADRPPRLIVVVDEATELLAPSAAKTDAAKETNALKGEAAEAIGSILRLGRAAGVHLLLAAQRADRAILSGEAQNNLAFKILQGRSEQIERTMIGLSDVLATPGVPGRAVARTLRIPQCELQVAYTDVGVDLDRYLPVGGTPQPQAPTVEGPTGVPVSTTKPTGPYAPRPATTGDDDEKPEYTFKRVEPYEPGQAQSELDAMIGLPGVRREVSELAASVQMELERAQLGIGGGTIDLQNLVFAGAPGTGKTTVARIVGSLLRDVGALPSGHVVEVGRGDLVGTHIGQTEPKTRAAIDAALGGVLFVDEAYSLAGRGDNDFGAVAIEELLVAAENLRGKLVVIIAGYTDKMNGFLDANPGLPSRFTGRITFEDYTNGELAEIARGMIAARHREFDRAASDALAEVFAGIPRGRDWGNARTARNLVAAACKIADSRIAKLAARTRADLVLVTEPDLGAAADRDKLAAAAAEPEPQEDLMGMAERFLAAHARSAGDADDAKVSDDNTSDGGRSWLESVGHGGGE